MTNTNSDCSRIQADFRAFALKTLALGRQRVVEEHLRDCAACQRALASERKHLEILEVLAVEAAPDGLAERTLENILAPRRSYARLVVVAAVLLLLVLPTFRVLDKSREAARNTDTQANMKKLGLLFKMYANESRGACWPLLADADGEWAPNFDAAFGALVSDGDLMVSEQHPDRARLKHALEKAWSGSDPDLKQAEALMGESFAYLGYSVSNEAEFEALCRAREQHSLPSDAEVPGTNPGEALHPLREGIERFLITDINNPAATSDAQSGIPVLIEIATWKYKDSLEDFKGTNVLYMDGHVAFVPLGTFPVLPSILDALSGGKG